MCYYFVKIPIVIATYCCSIDIKVFRNNVIFNFVVLSVLFICQKREKKTRKNLPDALLLKMKHCNRSRSKQIVPKFPEM